MSENWRLLLYYPLGILPTFFFTLRILVQWWQSEKLKTSYAGRTFWRLSLAGNICLMLHYFVQVQFPFSLLQAGNAVISWRNLNLIKARNRVSTTTTIVILLGSLALLTLAFMAQSTFIIGEMDWIRTPEKLFDGGRQRHSLVWHIIGTFGTALFASRFWIQWWQTERAKRSELGNTFWWLSIGGSVISLLYFLHIQDTISAFYYSFGLIPYARNLLLLRRRQET